MQDGISESEVGIKPPQGKEFNFSEVKRPFTIDDVKDFQRQFKEFDASNRAQGGRYQIGENQFYEYLNSGSFWGAEKPGGNTPEILSDDGKQGYNDLLLSTYKGWRENLIKDKDRIGAVRPELIKQLGDLSQLPNPQNADEVRNLYAANPKLNELSAAQYQDGLVKGVVNTDFLHFQGHRYNAYKYEKPETEMRLYVNPPINEAPKLASEFVRIANERGIPYYFKMIDFALQDPLPESLKRVDRMLFYSDKANAAKIAGILEEIKTQHPGWFVDRPLPPMTAKIMDGVGIAAEPDEDQHKKYSNLGKNRTSFNSVRAKFLDRLWPGIVKNIMIREPGLRPRGGRDLKQIFNDFVPAEDKHYIDGLWASSMNPPAEDKSAKRVMDSAIRRMMVDVVPTFSPESILPWLNRGAEVLGSEFGIDPDNLALNKAV